MNNILFIGTYQRRVDSKGRVSIPAQWRKRAQCTFYYYQEKFFINLIDLIDFFNDIKLQDIMPNVIKYNLDPEGRVVIKSQTGKTAIFKGCGDYFTIEFLD
jgi:DNA-binding transcriptional regulator/RsmH inhibitor MraZ